MGLRDWRAWLNHETKVHHTKESIAALDASPEIKALITFDIEENRPGGVPSAPARWQPVAGGFFTDGKSYRTGYGDESSETGSGYLSDPWS